jgi:hypothetical protein
MESKVTKHGIMMLSGLSAVLGPAALIPVASGTSSTADESSDTSSETGRPESDGS